MTSRRTFLATVLGGSLAAPLATRAQRAGKVYRIGFVWDTPAVWPHALEAFRQGLRELGWIEGQNIVIEYRWTEGHFDRLAGFMAELVRLKVDLIVAPTSIYTGAAKQATSTIPIMSETMTKSLELLQATIPGLTRVAVIWDPATPSHAPGLKAIEAAGGTLGLRLQTLAVRSAAELDGAFSAIVREGAGAALVLSTPLFIGEAKQLAKLALTYKVPTMFGPREHVEAGGLLSYGPDRSDLYRRAAGYVDKILKGANPADLPVQQATKFEFVINLTTARTLGLTIPQSVLVRADEVLQ